MKTLTCIALLVTVALSNAASAQTEIRAAVSGLCLSVYGGDTSRVSQEFCNGKLGENFELAQTYDGSYTLRTAQGLCLDIPYGSSQQGVQLQQAYCNGGANQEFYFRQAGYGNLIVNRGNGMCLNVANNYNGMDRQVGTPIIQWQCTGSENEIFNLQGLNQPQPQPQPYPPQPYPPYPPHPHPPGYLCTVTTARSQYQGQGFDQGQAVAAARSSCLRFEPNYSCNSGSVVCRLD